MFCYLMSFFSWAQNHDKNRALAQADRQLPDKPCREQSIPAAAPDALSGYPQVRQSVSSDSGAATDTAPPAASTTLQ